MTVFLDKPLTERQQWVLNFLVNVPSAQSGGWISCHEYYDDGFGFIGAFVAQFFKEIPRDEGHVLIRRRLQYVLHQLRDIGLVDSRDGSNHGVIGTGDHGPSHCNEYRITNRGRRAAISHDTYDEVSS